MAFTGPEHKQIQLYIILAMMKPTAKEISNKTLNNIRQGHTDRSRLVP
jgi:hypothetical protein